MTLALFLAVAPPLVTASLLVLWLAPMSGGGLNAVVFKVSLAVGCALGLSSCSFFLWRIVLGSHAQLSVAEGGLYLGAIAVLMCAVHRARKSRRLLTLAGRPAHRSRAYACLVVGLSALLVLTALARLVLFLLLSRRDPHGHFDAIAIWNVRARFLARCREHGADAFVPELFHADYPLLVPASIARVWLYLETESTWVPALVALLFTSATVGVLYAAVALLRGKLFGCTAGLLLLGTSAFIVLGTWQYADVPASYFFLSVAALFGMKDWLRPQDLRLAALAGVMAGFAGWAKNEGLLFVALVPLSRAVVLSRLGSGAYLRELCAFGAGVLPVALIILYFKVIVAPPSDLFAGQNLHDLLGRLGTPSRYGRIAMAILTDLSRGLLIPLLGMAAYLLLAGRGRAAPAWQVAAAPALLLALMLGSYFAVYLVTPHDLEWHLKTSLSRLLMQLWPMALFVYFLTVAAPEEALARSWAASGPTVPQADESLGQRPDASPTL
jgi:hypothetical protein